MAYRTIATVVTDLEAGAATLDSAVALAEGLDAHLDVLCLGLDRTQPAAYYTGPDMFPVQDMLGDAREEAAAIEEKVRELLARSGVRHDIAAAGVPMSGLNGLVAGHVQYADLAVLARPYGESRTPEDVSILEAALFGTGTPVLVLPPGHGNKAVGGRIVIAWNESPGALSAVRAALPLLQASSASWIAVVDPPVHAADRSDPGGALAQMLSRHGVHAEVAVLAKSVPRISDVLCRFALDMEADMIVMGAYGHSRLREAILGGATRNMLQQAEVPVLMSH
ncbi:universal stress protein [Roseitranquillus sediminis]|uniref:universal stress protein n=1 Tax=Roseitranquillus sediminis TaxID=2809051 RepID=UPI001D0C4F07|nr:universal stress protein [Roseitranquillus sediminis]MBM9593529.1 universal stress protein [Roseitranquillus sediminis]